MRSENLELLAPAGNIESFYAAVNSGADAVYLGLPEFNARMRAENFNYESLARAIRFAHFHGAKVYITVNTLIKNSELSDFLKSVKKAVLLRADAFIVQDFGAAYALKKCFPDIVLHASTQMGIHNLEGALEAERLGIKRVVLSRETKIEDIKAISKNTGLELEFFVQGALCSSFSGNCYISAATLGKSGNRGLCAQLCRHSYFWKGQEGCYFSAVDLCLLDSLKELAGAGITSFKIEGRLRRSGYVAEAVSVYREALDRLPDGFGSAALKYRLKKAFNRGEFSERAYLDKGTPNNIINPDGQNHQGVEIGRVIKAEPFKDIFKITVESSAALHSGDGLKFFSNGKEALSLGVGNVEKLAKGVYALYSKGRPEAGMTVNLLLDSEAEKRALSVTKKEKLTVTIHAEIGKRLELQGSCRGICVSAKSEYMCPEAERKGTQNDEIVTQLSKSADSGFEITVDIKGSLIGNVFLPKSVLNAARRELLTQMEEEVISFAEKDIPAAVSESEIEKIQRGSVFPAEYRKLIYLKNGINPPAVKEENAVYVLCPESYGADNLKAEIQRIKARYPDITLALDLPVIANGEDMKVLSFAVETLQAEFRYLIVNNLYGYAFKGKAGLIAGYGMNILNDLSAKVNEEAGAEIIVKSLECAEELNSHAPLAVLGNFDLPLMTFAHCFSKTVSGAKCDMCGKQTVKSFRIEKDGEAFILKRYRVANCYYRLFKEI